MPPPFCISSAWSIRCPPRPRALVLHGAVHRHAARARALFRERLLADAQLHVQGVAHEDGLAPLAAQLGQRQAGAVHQPVHRHAGGQARGDGQGQQAVRGALTEGVLGGEHRVGVQRVVVAREAFGQLLVLGSVVLTSLQNPLVKQIRKLHSAKERHKQQLFCVWREPI